MRVSIILGEMGILNHTAGSIARASASEDALKPGSDSFPRSAFTSTTIRDRGSVSLNGLWQVQGVMGTLGVDSSLSLGGSAGGTDDFFSRWAIGLSSDRLCALECFPKIIGENLCSMERVTRMTFFAFDRLAAIVRRSCDPRPTPKHLISLTMWWCMGQWPLRKYLIR